jgi:hypothetical protein
VRDDAGRLDPAAEGERRSSLVEEDQIEGEAHAEGMHAGAARQQQAATRLATLEKGEAEQAGAEVGRARHRATESLDRRQAPQAPSEGMRGHSATRTEPRDLSPGATRRSGAGAPKQGDTMIGMIQDLSPLGLRRRMGFNRE